MHKISSFDFVAFATFQKSCTLFIFATVKSLINKGYPVHTGYVYIQKVISSAANRPISSTHIPTSNFHFPSLHHKILQKSPNEFDTEFDNSLKNQAKSQFPSILKIPKSTIKSHKTLEKQDNSRTNHKNHFSNNKILIHQTTKIKTQSLKTTKNQYFLHIHPLKNLLFSTLLSNSHFLNTF